MSDYGVASMSAPLRRVLVRRPALSGDWTGAGWRTPDPTLLAEQHDDFCALLDGLGVKVEIVGPVDDLVDAVYMHDSVVLVSGGAVAMNMRKTVRRPEPAIAVADLERLGVPVLGTVENGWCDGGDRFWLDSETMAFGLGYRTNRAGAEAVAAISGVNVEMYDIPHDQGPDHVLHLQSFLSAATDDLLVVYEPLAPVRLLQDLRERGFDWIAIDRESYDAMGCNVLCVRPGVVVVCDGAPAVRRALESRGVEVHSYDGSELSVKGDGGPTCLTCPILR